MARSGLTEAQIQERMNSQFSPEQKRQFADFTINNNSTTKDFFSALELILDIVLSLPEKDFENTEE
jgi:dephospho-CoA kinase